MHRIAGGVLVLLLALPALWAADDPKDKPATPGEQYKALVKEYSQAQQEFFKAYQAASDEEKPKMLKEKYPEFGPKFLELAEKNPKDPVAVDALVWVASNRMSRTADKDESLAKALDMLLKDHVDSEKLAGVCERLVYNNTDAPNPFLTTVLEKSTRKDVKAEACLALGQRRVQRARMCEEVNKDPNSCKQLTDAYGKEYVEAIQKDDPGKLYAEAEKYYRQVTDNYLTDLAGKRLSTVCVRMAYNTDKASEALLRGLLEKDTRDEVQGSACVYLGKLLMRRADDLPETEAKDAAKLHKESEGLLERAAAKYADVTLLGRHGTVGKLAKVELFTLRNLTTGKVAPDIDSEDQDGKKFKLSDYRGKVVLLDFWSQF
jgi:hypothetical protein